MLYVKLKLKPLLRKAADEQFVYFEPDRFSACDTNGWAQKSGHHELRF